jgi:hypothetical protein
MEHEARAWLNLHVTPDVRQALIASDHVLDAFLSALAAAPRTSDGRRSPRPDQAALAAAEGWIHVPRPESFEGLAP